MTYISQYTRSRMAEQLVGELIKAQGETLCHLAYDERASINLMLKLEDIGYAFVGSGRKGIRLVAMPVDRALHVQV